jgi:hypothetical protein
MIPLRDEYKQFKKEYYEPYMKKMQEYLDETTEKYNKENDTLKELNVMNEHKNRQSLTADQKKTLTKKIGDSEKIVEKLKTYLERIKLYSGLN